MNAAHSSQPRRSEYGLWWTRFVALTLVVFGLPIAAGGLWLITLGGSWYYLPAGIGLLLAAALLFWRSPLAVWAYLVTYIGTVVWALWEAGLDPWAQVPRLVAPTVMLILILTTLPTLRRPARRRGLEAAAAMGTLVVASGAIALAYAGAGPTAAQQADEPARPVDPPDAPGGGERGGGVAPAGEPSPPLTARRPRQRTNAPRRAPSARPKARIRPRDSTGRHATSTLRPARTGPPTAAARTPRAIRR